MRDRFRQITPAQTLLALLLVVAVVSPRLHAESGAQNKTALETSVEGYRPDKQATAWRSSISAVDSTDLSTNWTDGASTADVATFTIGDRTTLSVSPRMTTASATCTVRVAFYHRYSAAGQATTWTLLGVDTATAFTCDVETEAGVYTDETFLFDTYGATHALILVSTAPSSGTLDLWVGSY